VEEDAAWTATWAAVAAEDEATTVAEAAEVVVAWAWEATTEADTDTGADAVVAEWARAATMFASLPATVVLLELVVAAATAGPDRATAMVLRTAMVARATTTAARRAPVAMAMALSTAPEVLRAPWAVAKVDTTARTALWAADLVDLFLGLLRAALADLVPRAAATSEAEDPTANSLPTATWAADTRRTATATVPTLVEVDRACPVKEPVAAPARTLLEATVAQSLSLVQVVTWRDSAPFAAKELPRVESTGRTDPTKCCS
jgi:hypothetical protein